MNSSIRKSVREAMEKKQVSQSELARDIGVTKQYLNNYLTGKDGDVPKLWQKVFDHLDLELEVKQAKGEGSSCQNLNASAKQQMGKVLL